MKSNIDGNRFQISTSSMLLMFTFSCPFAHPKSTKKRGVTKVSVRKASPLQSKKQGWGGAGGRLKRSETFIPLSRRVSKLEQHIKENLLERECSKKREREPSMANSKMLPVSEPRHQGVVWGQASAADLDKQRANVTWPPVTTHNWQSVSPKSASIPLSVEGGRLMRLWLLYQELRACQLVAHAEKRSDKNHPHSRLLSSLVCPRKRNPQKGRINVHVQTQYVRFPTAGSLHSILTVC